MATEPLFPTRCEWRTITLGEACTLGGGDVQTGPFGSQLHASDYVPTGIPSIMPQNIGDNRVLIEGIARIKTADAERLSRYRVKTGDIVYSRRGDVERRALIREEQDGWLCGTGCLRVRFGSGPVNPEYASFYLGHPAVRAWIVRHAVGATMPNLNTTILSSLPFVLPPLPAQDAIAHVLGNLDDKIDLNRRMNQTLDAMAQALFRSWFVDFDPVRAKAKGRQPDGMDAGTAALFPSRFVDSELGEIPEGWSVRRLGDVTSLLTRGISPFYTEHEGVLVLNQKCVRGSRVHFGKGRRHDSSKRSVDGRLLKLGDVLINSTGVGTLGRVGQIDYLPEFEVIVDSHVTVVRANPEVLSPLLLGIDLLQRESEIEALGEGSTGQTELGRERLRSLTVLMAPIPVQEAFAEMASGLRQRIAGNERESETLAQLRDLLLPKLLSGEIRVRDAEAQLAATA